MSKKYDTNPLDHDVKKKADQSLGVVDEDSATAELPSDISTIDAATSALDQQPAEHRGPARPTGPGLSNPTSVANPMTRAEMHSPGTGPAYLPPSSGGIGNQSAGFSNPPSYQPNHQGNQPGYQPTGHPGYQPGYQPGQRPGYVPGYGTGQQAGYQNAQYPPQYSPMTPGARPNVPYGGARQNKGLGIDPNIEGALCYFPWLGWLMAIIVLVKEPKTNMFARFHALQSLLLHGGMIVLNIVFGILAGTGDLVGEHGMKIFFSVASGAAKFAAFVGFIILGILALQMKTPKVPVVSDFAEKLNTSK